MRNASRFIGSLILAATLVAPVAIMAAPAPQNAGVQIRIYDRNHKDYHNWDDRESHAWGIFLTDNHRKAHEYSRASKREQSQYWNWRHQHPDRD
jgi:hypothetical protein